MKRRKIENDSSDTRSEELTEDDLDGVRGGTKALETKGTGRTVEADDDNGRAGFEVHGFINTDDPT